MQLERVFYLCWPLGRNNAWLGGTPGGRGFIYLVEDDGHYVVIGVSDRIAGDKQKRED